jgi:hypothetical protein
MLTEGSGLLGPAFSTGGDRMSFEDEIGCEIPEEAADSMFELSNRKKLS